MIYKREDTGFMYTCVLCKQTDFIGDVKHSDDCPFSDPAVEQVRVCGKCGTELETDAELTCVSCANSSEENRYEIYTRSPCPY